jgi:hypothetical protein
VRLWRGTGGKTATPLPDPLEGLARSRYKIKFNRGQLCMFAGAPGAGKTTAALIMAIQANVPCLYFSADSDEITMAARAASAITHHPYVSVRESQSAGLYEDLYGEQIAQLPIRWIFDPSDPSIDDISNAVTAYVELWGKPPELIVVDNLMNMRSDDGNEWQGLRQVVKDLHWMARRTKACIWLLHHTSEQDPRWISSAPPRVAIQGKLSQLPEIVLTLANDEGVFWVAVVKNRHGPSDPHARAPLRMIVDFVSMRIHDAPMMARGGYGGKADDHSSGRSEDHSNVSGAGGQNNWTPGGVLGGGEGEQGVIPGAATWS